MSDTVDEPLTEEPVEAEEPVEPEESVAEDPVASEAVEPEEPVEEAPVATEAVEPEEPVEEEPEEPVVEEPEEPVVEEPVEPEEPVEEESEESVPVEQVASDIREILAPVSLENSVSSDVSETDDLCSLKTLINVLGKWSGNEIRRRQVEDLLKEGSEVDENIDYIEKVVEVLQLWIQEGGSTFREHNYFKNIDEYTLVGESRELSEEKKVNMLKTLVELIINVSHRRLTNEEIKNVMDSLY
jgi:hypothetical protein